MDPAGETIEFMLSPKRDLIAAKPSCAWHYPAEDPQAGNQRYTAILRLPAQSPN